MLDEFFLLIFFPVAKCKKISIRKPWFHYLSWFYLNFFPFPLAFSFALFAWTKSRAMDRANLYVHACSHQLVLAGSEFDVDSRAQSWAGPQHTHTLIRLRWTSQVKSRQGKASIGVVLCWMDRWVRWSNNNNNYYKSCCCCCCCWSVRAPSLSLSEAHFVCLFPYQHFMFVEKGACALRKNNFFFLFFNNIF